MRHLVPMPLLGMATAAHAQAPALDITLAHDSEREAGTRDQLLRLLATHDVEPWIYTRTIMIDETQIPHSHPVLTVHARHLGDDMALLATFVHEQFHWLVSGRPQERADAIAAYRAAYPEVPSGNPEGARDENSTYLHLIVCDLEYQAMTKLIGQARAAEVLDATTHYTWIYDRVLTDPTVREVATRYGFVLR